MDRAIEQNLPIQVYQNESIRLPMTSRVLALGEVLWDVFDGTRRLGGAPLNFSVHVSRMGHEAALVSAVGEDDLGSSARETVQRLGVGTDFIQTTGLFPTGAALVHAAGDGQTHFRIQRPAAYDAVSLSDKQVEELVQWAPRWVYYGTLFAVAEQGRRTFLQLLSAMPGVATVYDLNLRPECYSPDLVVELLGQARAVKFSESEMREVGRLADLPSGIEAFCLAGARRYGWEAAAVTFGERGCAVWVDGSYARVDGVPVEVADAVGAGDAFAAAFVHGLSLGWPPREIGVFANRIGALVASRPGGVPEWSMDEVPGVGGRS